MDFKIYSATGFWANCFLKIFLKISLTKRTSIEYLEAHCHWEIYNSDLQPVGNDVGSAIVIEENACDEAHDRAHEAYDHGRDRQNHNNWSVFCRVNETKCQFLGEITYDEEFENKSNRPHNRQLMQCNEEYFIGKPSHVNCNIVTYHGIHHDTYHDNCVNYILKFCLWHNKNSFTLQIVN